MLEFHQQWYNFVIDELYRDIKLHELILVTSCDLTRQWEMATYLRNNQDINATSKAQAAPDFSLSAGWRVSQNDLLAEAPLGPSINNHFRTLKATRMRGDI